MIRSLTELLDALHEADVSGRLEEFVDATLRDETIARPLNALVRRHRTPLVLGGVRALLQAAAAYGSIALRQEAVSSRFVQSATPLWLARKCVSQSASSVICISATEGQVTPVVLAGRLLCSAPREDRLRVVDLLESVASESDVSVAGLARWSLIRGPRAKSILSWDRAGWVSVWKLAPVTRIQSFRTGHSAPRFAAVSDNGLLATVHSEDGLAVWALGEGKQLLSVTARNVRGLVISPDGGILAMLSWGHLTLVRPGPPAASIVVPLPTEGATAVAVSGPDSLVVVCGATLLLVKRARHVQPNVTTQTLPFDAVGAWWAGGRDRVLLSSKGGGWCAWNTVRACVEGNVERDAGAPGRLGPALAVSRGGATVATSSAVGVVVRDRRRLRRIGTERPNEPVLQVNAGREGVVCALLADGTLLRWTTGASTVVTKMVIPRDALVGLSLNISEDGCFACSRNSRGGLVFWSLATGERRDSPDGIFPSAMESVPRHGAACFLVASADRLTLWDGRLGVPVREFPPPRGTIHRISPTPDGRHALLQTETAGADLVSLESDAKTIAHYDAPPDRLCLLAADMTLQLLDDGRLVFRSVNGSGNVIAFEGANRLQRLRRDVVAVLGVSSTWLLQEHGQPVSIPFKGAVREVVASPDPGLVAVRGSRRIDFYSETGAWRGEWLTATRIDGVAIADGKTAIVAEAGEAPLLADLHF